MTQCSECNKELIDIRSKVCKSCAKKGTKNPQWKGNNVGYEALHEWIRKHKPKSEFCECCKKKIPLDLANISGKYLRDINDFEWLCRKCHMANDGRLKKFLSYCVGLKDSKNKKNPNYKTGKYCQDGVFGK